MDMYTFGSRLKDTRYKRNVSAEELAEVLGVNKATIHRYEAGVFKSIKEDRLQAIADYLNVSKDYLLGNTDKWYHNETYNFTIKPKELSDVINVITDLLTQESITVNGKPVDKETLTHIINYANYILSEEVKK